MVQKETPTAQNGEALIPLPKFVKFMTLNGIGPPIPKFGKLACFTKETKEGPLMAVIETDERRTYVVEISNIIKVI